MNNPTQRQQRRFFQWLCLGVLLSVLATGASWIAPVDAQLWGTIAVAQETPAAFEQGEAAYHDGDYTQAITLWQHLLTQTDDAEQRVTLLNNLSLAYQGHRDWPEAKAAIEDSLTLLGFDLQQQTPPREPQFPFLLGQSLDIYGYWHYNTNDAETAISLWQQAASCYTPTQPQQLQPFLDNQLNQVRALQYLGYYLEAQDILEKLYHNLNTATISPNMRLDSAIALGRSLRLTGVLGNPGDDSNQLTAIQTLTHAQEWIGAVDRDRISNLYSELGNTYQAIAERLSSFGEQERTKKMAQQSNTAYDNAFESATTPLTRIIIRLNQANLLIDQRYWQSEDQAAKVLTEYLLPIQSHFSELTNTPSSILARTKFASILIKLARTNSAIDLSSLNLMRFLSATVAQAESLHNSKMLSLAWGTLGSAYEYFSAQYPERLEDALRCTDKALQFSWEADIPEIRYRWLWQAARIFKQQGKIEQALAAYDSAIVDVTKARHALLPINSEIQFSFRDDVEPVYRQYVDLLTEQEESQQNLTDAVRVIDELQLSELENFLGCDLSSIRVDHDLDQIDADAVFVYPIILENRLEVIVKVPGKPLDSFHVAVSKTEVIARLKRIAGSLRGRNQQPTEDLETVYTWLIQPLEDELAGTEDTAKTLVMVLDSYFRNIPIVALMDPEAQDAKKYVIEKDYAVAILPTAQLFNLQPFNADQQHYLIAGIGEALTAAGKQFDKLSIDGEIEAVSYPPHTSRLINHEMTRANLADSRDAQVIHLITHGQFSSDPEETYFLAYGNQAGEGDLIRAREINSVFHLGKSTLSRELALLFLSACTTADGDDRAVLGLAGLTVKAGAAAAIASLWRVRDDSSTLLAKVFYQELIDHHVSKAEALHRAQLKLRQDKSHQNVYHWAPYVLIGNWL